MATNIKTKRIHRKMRHKRIRAKLSGVAKRPRIAIFKSNRYMYVQAIDDASGKTLASVNDVQKKGTKTKKTGTKSERAVVLGEKLAVKMKEAGLGEAVFDTAGFKYHGRVKAVAEGLRKGGIKI